MLDTFGKTFQIDAGRIRGQYRIRAHLPFQVREQRLFGIQSFDDCFDDQVGVGDAGGIRNKPRAGFIGRSRRPEAPPKQRLGPFQCGFHQVQRPIMDRHVESAQCAPGRDVATHHAGARHMDMPYIAGSGRQASQALAEEKYAYQVLGRGCLEQPADGSRLRLVRRRAARAVANPQVHQRERCGIVCGPRPAPDLRTQPPAQPRSHDPKTCDPVTQRCAPCWWPRQDEFLRGPVEIRFGHDAVNETRAPGFNRREGPAGQHEVQSRQIATQTHAANRSAQTGVYAQAHFGKPQIALMAFYGDSVVTGQRKLHAAAQCKAVDGGNGRAGQFLQLVQKLLSEPHLRFGLPGFRQSLELRNIRPGNETGRLAGLEHQSRGRVCGDFSDQLGHFRQDALRKHVGRTIRLVKNQPANAFGIVRCMPVPGHGSVIRVTREPDYRSELGARPKTRRNARLKPAADSYPACAATALMGAEVRRSSRRAFSIRQYRIYRNGGSPTRR